MKKLKVALIGNPNVGKTTLFNQLCGVNQKTGNYPGVTVDRKSGKCNHNSSEIEIIDFPGFDSVHPKSLDEELVVSYLRKGSSENKIDKILFIADGTNIKKSLYLLSQIRDLGYQVVLAINMIDIAKRKGIKINTAILEKEFGIQVVEICARKKEGLEKLKSTLLSDFQNVNSDEISYLKQENRSVLMGYVTEGNYINPYYAFLELTQEGKEEVDSKKWKREESILRYQRVREILEKAVLVDKSQAKDFTSRLDKILLHKVLGYVVFVMVLLVIFQSVFSLAEYPMGWIEQFFAWTKDRSELVLPPGSFTNFILEGLIPGIEGVVIFVPQIAILFFFFAVLDESGYMNRIIYLMDRLMQKVGMSGKSVVPLISSFACAVPAIMATRTIENKRERLITILVSPLLTCSARLPVYTILIGILVPDDQIFGFISLKALVLLGMYFLGIFTSIVSALVFKYIIKNKYRSFFISEMPRYLVPNFKNVFYTIWENTRAFVWSAGKIIVAAAIIIYMLKVNGGEKFDNAENHLAKEHPTLSQEELNPLVQSYQLENSYLGNLGKSIEPAIIPLGYDWKVGIALISSIAAREVFVGTINIIYSIGSDAENRTIINRLNSEINANTGKRTFNFATCISLLLFYAFALQCMSTIAVTYKETRSVKWTSIQFIYMTALAYFVSLIAYQVLS